LPVATSSTATSAIQTALGRGSLRATRTEGAGLAQATSTAAASAAQAKTVRRFTGPPRRGARIVGAQAASVNRTNNRVPRTGVVWERSTAARTEVILGFTTNDLPRLLDRVRAAGGGVHTDIRDLPDMKVHVAFATDPEGHLIEIVERSA